MSGWLQVQGDGYPNEDQDPNDDSDDIYDDDEFENSLVSCHRHGEGRRGIIVCTHLALGGMGRGLHFPDLKQGEESAQAWCSACEAVLDREGSWTDSAVETADFRLICDGCFVKVKAYNRLRLLVTPS